MAGYILPLCTIDEVRAELDDTERAIGRLGEFRIVDAERLDERRQRLNRWRDRLRDQLEQMEAAA